MKDSFTELQSLLGNFGKKFEILSDKVRIECTDICIIAGSPLIFHCVSPSGKYIHRGEEIISFREIGELFYRVCGYSIYSHNDEILAGYVSLGGKYRIGICGEANCEGSTVKAVNHITGMNIRVPHRIRCDVSNLADLLIEASGGLLIVGEPGSGKTTLLGNLVDSLSQNSRIAVIDERNEIAPLINENRCFVLKSYPKILGMQQALRLLSPEYIICDEMSYSDISAAEETACCGVKLIATAHGGRRGNKTINSLLQTEAFEKIAFLKGRSSPSVVLKVIDCHEFNEITRSDARDNIRSHGCNKEISAWKTKNILPL